MLQAILQIYSYSDPLPPPHSREFMLCQLLFSKDDSWQLYRSFHNKDWEVNDVGHKMLRTLCFSCHLFAAQQMQWFLYPVWSSVRFIQQQLLLYKLERKKKKAEMLVVRQWLPRCLWWQLLLASILLRYVTDCFSCLWTLFLFSVLNVESLSQSHFFLGFWCFAAMSAGENQQKTQTGRSHKAYKCDCVLFMFIWGVVLKGEVSEYSADMGISKQSSIRAVILAFLSPNPVPLSQVPGLPKVCLPQHSSDRSIDTCSLLDKPTSHFTRIKLHFESFALFCPLHIRTHKCWLKRDSCPIRRTYF